MKFNFHPAESDTKDTGLVTVLILLLIAYWTGKNLFILLAIGTLVVAMTIPIILTPLAVIWYYFSTALGQIINRIILTIVFAVVLTPVGIVRRWMGIDPMKRKAWKNGVQSVFTERNHTFTSNDLKMPY